jgi:hypothetical protein
MNVTTIGLDLAKSVFQVHGIDAHGKALITRQLRRGKVLEFFANLPACLVGIEACPSAHHWAREISKLRSCGASDAARLRKALCQARQERSGRRRGDLRGSAAANHALRSKQQRNRSIARMIAYNGIAMSLANWAEETRISVAEFAADDSVTKRAEKSEVQASDRRCGWPSGLRAALGGLPHPAKRRIIGVRIKGNSSPASGAGSVCSAAAEAGAEPGK